MTKHLIKVDSPDHPFTFDGPDELLSNTTGLLAIFKVRPDEANNPTRLFSRISNSLIAYPAYTKMVLLLNHKQAISNIITQYGSVYVSELIESKDLKKASSLLQDKKTEYQIKDFKKIQQRIFSSQSIIQMDNLKYFNENTIRKKEIQKSLEKLPKAKYSNPFSNTSIQSRANIFKLNQQVYGFKKLDNKKSDLIDLRPYFEFSIYSDFKVDNGIPHFFRMSQKVLNVDSFPSIKIDPLKPLRIASLFGWHFVNATETSELEQRRQTINDI